VHNELDGSVTLEIQGEQGEIIALLEMIERGPFISIDHINSQELPVNPDENSFEVK